MSHSTNDVIDFPANHTPSESIELPTTPMRIVVWVDSVADFDCVRLGVRLAREHAAPLQILCGRAISLSASWFIPRLGASHSERGPRLTRAALSLVPPEVPVECHEVLGSAMWTRTSPNSRDIYVRPRRLGWLAGALGWSAPPRVTGLATGVQS